MTTTAATTAQAHREHLNCLNRIYLLIDEYLEITTTGDRYTVLAHVHQLTALDRH